MVTTVGHPSSVAFMVKARGFTVERHGLLIVQAPLDGGRQIELYQLEILTLGLGLEAILHILNVRFKIALYAEDVKR